VKTILRQVTATHVSTLRDYLQVARRRKWIIVQAAVIVPLAALAFSLQQTAQYQGSAQVLLSQQDIGSVLTGTQTSLSSADPADRLTQTQAELARVPNVASRAIRELGLSMTTKQFLSNSSVLPGTNSDTLTLHVTNHNPVLASRMAAAYAKAYVAYRLQVETAPIEVAKRGLDQRLATAVKGSALYNGLVEKEQTLQELEALKTSNANVIQSGTAAVQTAPKTARNVVLGVVLGLFLGIGLAFLRESLDTRVRSADVIGEKLELPLLARLPEPPKKVRAEGHLVMLDEPSSVHAEAFRMLRTNVEFASLGKAVKTLMVTSALEQEGKSTTIANLAVALAKSGQHVVLVDLDLRRPFVDRFFGLEGRPGVTQVAIGAAALGNAIVRIPILRDDAFSVRSARTGTPANGNGNGNGLHKVALGALDVLPAGAIPPNPGEFVGSARLTEVLEHIANHCDVVLIDAPPLFHVGDALTLSAKVDAVLVVANLDKMRRPMLGELKRQLDTMPANKLGFVVAGAEEENGYGYGYGGYYYQRSYERAAEEQIRA
jgi:Mrp family chromosome partitioning ATPase/capsular polysaccharide biosynthesis protein